MVYIAQVYGKDGQPTGEWYVGRTRGPADASTKAILNKRFSGHHRRKKGKKRKETIGPLTAVCETDSYAAVRGAEEKHQKAMADAGIGTKQINPISPKPSNKAKKEKYMACAKEINGRTCSTCGE